jgi:HAD superfamily phosphoserine phosphatase-like hydrolase
VKILVSDFDGTITRRDFYALLAERYVPASAPDYFAEYRAGRLSHFDAMAAYFAHAPTDEASLEALLRDTEPDPGFGPAAARLAAAGWELVIVSAGCGWYIGRILEAHGVQAVVHANPGRIVPGKAAVTRDALARAEVVAFAGDGPPDVEPARLVPPSRRFARGFLAEELRRRGESFRLYHRWPEVVEALL